MSGHRVELDQEYVACRPTPSMPGEHYIRIRVVHPGPLDGHKSMIATIYRDSHGRESLDRRRLIATSQLHNNPKRRTGYRLATPGGAA